MTSQPVALLLMLLDSRAPAGAQHHSGGLEPAVAAGYVTGVHDLEAFCRGRLHTSGRVAASFAAAAWRLASEGGSSGRWADLDAALDARTPSEAIRAASRSMGSGLRRLIRVLAPASGDVMDGAWAGIGRPAPHHPLVLGFACYTAAGIAGGAELAARVAALGTCTSPASAAVRLLGLDPFAVQAVLARLAPDVDGVAREAAAAPVLADNAAPALDLLADAHLLTEGRLFAS